MRILVTNDDGVKARGLKILVEQALKFGEVICVAPIEEQSGKSHSIIIKEPFVIKKYEDIVPGVKTYGIGSTPGDCVRIAHYYLKEQFDLVLSGINNGYNLGEDILYSGTIGAATEGILCGKKAIAFSTKVNHFDNLDLEVGKILKMIIEEKMLQLHNFWNVNICDNPKGIKYTYQGCTNFDAYYEDVSNDEVFSRGGPDLSKEKDRTGSDVCAIYNGYISISPLTADRTNYNILNKVNNKL